MIVLTLNQAITLGYLIVGLLLYPGTVDMWYRKAYRTDRFFHPGYYMHYTGFIVNVLFWPIVYPWQLVGYFKTMRGPGRS